MAEQQTNIFGSLLGSVTALGTQAIATFGGGDTVAPTLATGTRAPTGGFADFIKSPIGIIAAAGAGIGLLVLLLRK